MTIDGISTIGFVGAGQIGGQLSRLCLARGYAVVLSNSRGPETLKDLIDVLGAGAEADSAAGAAARGDLVVVTVPLRSIDGLPEDELAGKVVLDTCNYYPERDGHIPALDEEVTTTSQLVQDALPRSQVVKAFNAIFASDITNDVRPPGTPHRRAIAVAGDDDDAKALVAAFVDDLGYDTVDLGDLSESWRIQRDTPGYTADLDADELVEALEEAVRPPA